MRIYIVEAFPVCKCVLRRDFINLVLFANIYGEMLLNRFVSIAAFSQGENILLIEH